MGFVKLFNLKFLFLFLVIGFFLSTIIRGISYQENEFAKDEDNNKIVFMTIENDLAFVYISNTDGSENRLVFSEDAKILPGMFSKFITLSPDNQKIAYVTADDPSMRNAVLWIINVDGTNKKPIGFFENNFWTAELTWSPDSSQLAYVVLSGFNFVPGESSDIHLWRVDINTLQHYLVTNSPEFNSTLFGKIPKIIHWTESTKIEFVDIENKILYKVDINTNIIEKSGLLSYKEKFFPSFPYGITLPCPVPILNQNDPRWKNTPLNGCPGLTIGSAGCVLTSVAMVFKYYGGTYLPPDLNNCMGNYACPFDWYYSLNCKGGANVNNIYAGIAFSWSRLDQELSVGRPVIVKMRKNACGTCEGTECHFVVVTGGSGQVPSGYTINDPWDGTTYKTLNNYTSVGYQLCNLYIYTGTATCCTDPYEPNDSSPNAYGPIIPGVPYEGKICTSSDVDWFKVNISTPGTISLSLTVPSSNDYDMELYNPAGVWVAGSYNGTGASESINYNTSTTGNYYLRIYGYNGSYNTTNSYTLTFNFITPGNLSVSPADGLSSSGPVGGPFSPSSKAYTLQNTGGSSLNWTASKTQNWVSLSSTSGTLAPGQSTSVTISINSNANNLSAGTYTDTVNFTNTTNGLGNTTRTVTLTVSSSPGWLQVTPNLNYGFYIFRGGPVPSITGTYTLQNTGGTAINYQITKTKNWLDISLPTSGTLNPGQSTNKTVSINSNCLTLMEGTYSDTITFTNTTNGNGNTTRTVELGVNYNMWITVRGTNNQIYQRELTPTGSLSSWRPLAGYTNKTPASAMFNNRNYIIVKSDINNDIWLNSVQPNPARTFGTWLKIDGATPDKMAAAVFNNRLYIVVRGMDNRIYYRYMTTDGAWSSWSTVPGGNTNVPPAIAAFNNYLYLIVKDVTDNKIWRNKMSTAGTWSGWQLMDGLSPSTSALTEFNGLLYIVVRGSDNRLYIRSMNTSEVFTSWVGLSGWTDDSPAICSYNNKLYLVVKGLGSNDIWYNSMTTAGSWGTWVKMDGASPVTASVVAPKID